MTDPTAPVAKTPVSALLVVFVTLPTAPDALTPVIETTTVCPAREENGAPENGAIPKVMATPASYLAGPYQVVARRSRAVLVVFDGIVRVNVPAVTVCEPKVCTLTALLDFDEL